MGGEAEQATQAESGVVNPYIPKEICGDDANLNFYKSVCNMAKGHSPRGEGTHATVIYGLDGTIRRFREWTYPLRTLKQ